MMTDRILSHSRFSHIVDVPIKRVDISDWLFNLPEAEYQRRSRSHRHRAIHLATIASTFALGANTSS
jgi:hypothetical protein